MIDQLKDYLHFPIAWYFRFFAQIRLRRWNPRIVVVTGSNGKTTLLHMVESQMGEKAKYSHYANTAFGIPFDILELHRKSLASSEWIMFFLKAPLQVFAKLPKETIYVVEADCDRPGEGKFLASLLRPEVVLWVSVSRTHGMNYDYVVTSPPGGWQVGSHPPGVNSFQSVEEAIAYEYGYFLEACPKLAVIDGDTKLQTNQTHRSRGKVVAVKKAQALTSYTISKDNTSYEINKQRSTFDALLPEELFYSIAMCREAVEYFSLPFDPQFKKFILPPGRGTLLKGIKQTTLVDSTYNANLESIRVMLHMFSKMPGKKKWVVLGDMLELGKKEQEEHERLAEVLAKMDLERIILVGKRMKEFTAPKLVSLQKDVITVASAKEALDDIQKNLQGGEEILFKGSQSIYLEGVIEKLLTNKSDSVTLPRQSAFWKAKRKSLGL